MGPRRSRTLAQVITKARIEEGLSQRQLAQAMGVSPNTVSALEKGGDARLSILTGLVEQLPGLQPQDVLPDRDVQRRDRLVADQHAGFAGQRASDCHPLRLAAGELVRQAAA